MNTIQGTKQVRTVGTRSWKAPKNIELLGMALVFAAGGWEIFIQRPLVAMEATAVAYEQDQKLDALWQILMDRYTHEYSDRTDVMMNTNADLLFESWKYAGSAEPDRINYQAKFATVVTSVALVTGSLLILVAKFLEGRSNSS